MNNITNKIIITDSNKNNILLKKNNMNKWDIPAFKGSNKNIIVKNIKSNLDLKNINLHDTFEYNYYSSITPPKITRTFLTTTNNENIKSNEYHWMPWHRALKLISIYDLKKK